MFLIYLTIYCTIVTVVNSNTIETIEIKTLREKVRRASIIALANKSINPSKIKKYETVNSGGIPVCMFSKLFNYYIYIYIYNIFILI